MTTPRDQPKVTRFPFVLIGLHEPVGSYDDGVPHVLDRDFFGLIKISAKSFRLNYSSLCLHTKRRGWRHEVRSDTSKRVIQILYVRSTLGKVKKGE